MKRTLEERQHAVNAPRPPAAEALSGLVVTVLRLAAALGTAGDALSRPSGQSTARWQVLAAAEHGPATVAALARALSLTRQSVQRVADVLVADGLAAYTDNPAHERAKLVNLTPRGRSVLRTIQTAQAAWASRLADGLDPAHLQDVDATLRDIHARLTELG